MSSIKQKVKSILEDGQKCIESKVEIIRLDSMEKTVNVIGFIVTWSIIILVGIIFFVMVSLTAGFFLTELFESPIIGFGIVAGFYFLLLIIMILFRGALIRKGVEESMYGYFIESKIKKLNDDE